MEVLRSAILSEIQALVHVFRQDYVKLKSTQLQGLASLRVHVYQWTDLADFESQTVLRPFLDIVRNENTTGPLTRTAMESVCTILQAYESSTTSTSGLSMQYALSDVVDAVTQCRFQETDPESDQYVLLMVVRVLDMVMQCRDATRQLHAGTMWHVVESLYGISRSYEVTHLAMLSFLMHTTTTDNNIYQVTSSLSVGMATLPLWRLLWVHLGPHLTWQWEALVLGGIVPVLTTCLNDQDEHHDDRHMTWKVEVAQLMVDFLRDPLFVIDGFITYDCAPNPRANVVAAVLDALFFEAIETSGYDGHSETTELACLGVLNALQMLYRRAQLHQQHLSCGGERLPSPETLLAQRQRKQLFQDAITTFNTKPSAGIDLLASSGFLPTPVTPHALGKLPQPESSPRSKAPITNNQSKPRHDSIEFRAQLRQAYVETFELHQMPLVDALRTFLGAFRLPGEAQQIDRILEAFATHCRERDLFGCVDVAYLLSFSMIMLNTDLHNANIRADKKMSCADFVKNNVNYGLSNQGTPLPEPFLISIYHNIATNQFRTSDTDPFGPDRY
ncbi:hypothetical protein DYB28_001199 [Aphanomyces astaci]|uniref:SEC7 domain-containing protein n=1 Tax=Aphanomyces astaci TaxID=112090 RepID=A0A9X8EDA1_APHAT|nr:hypothetical protein DYB28_001199 [Aphanomyces astaci]